MISIRWQLSCGKSSLLDVWYIICFKTFVSFMETKYCIDLGRWMLDDDLKIMNRNCMMNLRCICIHVH